MRKAFARSPAVYASLDRQLSKMLGPKGGRQYTCEICRGVFGRGKVQIDHISTVIPIGSSAKDMTFDEIAGRMNVGPDKLRVLCKKCHEGVTQEQNAERARLRKEKKFVFEGDRFYVLEGGEVRFGWGVDKIRGDEIKYIEKSYKTMRGVNKYLSKNYPNK